jgi:serine/threonine-protein kinase
VAAESSSITRLGSYELLAELATGGMATVYVARQSGISRVERLVVVKRVHPHLLRLPKFREMFQDEARVVSVVQHPNVVRLLDVVDLNGELLIVLEYVESVSLSTLQRTLHERHSRLNANVAVRIVADVLAGLQAAHSARDVHGASLDIVHRDVSPQNVIVGVDGRSHLIDFGIAKASSRLTETTGGTVKGKLSYMSPEQAKAGDVDSRSDLFSAGVVLHEALTGERLFESDRGDGSHVLLKILLDEIAPPSSIHADLPSELDAVVLHALERVRDERFATASEFRHALIAAVKPASDEEVAREVERLAGDSIKRRREQLRRILDGVEKPRVHIAPASLVPQLATDAETVAAVNLVTPTPTKPRTTRRSGVPAFVLLVAGLGGATLLMKSRHANVASHEPTNAAGTPDAPASTALSSTASSVVSTAARPSAPSTASAPSASTARTSTAPTRHPHVAPPIATAATSLTATAATPPASASSAPHSTDLHNDNPY